MFRLHSLRSLICGRRLSGVRTSRRQRFQPRLELLEDRLVPTVFTVNPTDVSNNGGGTTGGLVWAINQANANGQNNTIELAAKSTYDLTAVNNFWYGPNGLPAISDASGGGHSLTIDGNGATIERNASAPAFRLFYVSGGLDTLPAGQLTLNDLTLENGLAQGGKGGGGVFGGGGGAGLGGAIYNQGILGLDGVTLTANTASGGAGGSSNSENGFGGGGGLGGDGGNGAGSGVQDVGGGGGGFSTQGGQSATNSIPGQGGPGINGNEGGSPGAAGAFGGGGGGGNEYGASFSYAGNGGIGGGGGGAGDSGLTNKHGNGGFGGGGGGQGNGGFGGGGGGFNGLAGFGGGAGDFYTGGGGAGFGGALFNDSGSTSLTNCVLDLNTAKGGAAVNNFFGAASGSGSAYGGAIFNLNGDVTLTDSALISNTIALVHGAGNQAGGAVYNLADGADATINVTSSVLAASIGGSDVASSSLDSHVASVNQINKANPVITWATPAAITFGTSLSSTQLDATANVAGSFMYIPAAGTLLSAGTQTLAACFTPTDTTDYNTVWTTVALTVNKAAPGLSWTPPAAITYGTLLSATQLDATAAALGGGTFTYTPAAGTELTGGVQTLSVTFQPADSADYNSATATVPLTVNQAVPLITWPPEPAPILAGIPLSPKQLDASASVTGTFSYSPSLGTGLPAGVQTLTVTFTPANNTDYTTATASVPITVLGLPTVTWSTPASITYGTLLSSDQLDATADIPGTFTYTPGNLALLPAGDQTLSVTFVPTDTDYVSETATVTLTVNQAAPTITWPAPAAIAYGTALSSVQLDASADVPGTFTYTPAVGAVLSAGSQTLSVSFQPADSADYSAVNSTVPLAVNLVTPSITWSTPAPITFGTALSAAQLDAVASVPGTFTYSPQAGTVPGAGVPTLTATFQPTDSTDFSPVSVSVPLDVRRAVPIVTWPATTAITYGTPLSAAQLDATASVPGTFTYGPEAGTILPVGTRTLLVTFNPNDTADNYPVSASVTLTVNKATPVITWADPDPIIVGTRLSREQLDATANTAGTFTYTPSRGQALKAGFGETLNVTFTPADKSDYTTATASVPIDALPIGASRSPGGVLYVAGKLTTPNITVQLSQNTVIVNLHNSSPSFQTSLTGLTELVVYGRADHQSITVGPNLLLPAILFAGDGDAAQVQGGGGPTVEVGGTGSGDILIGGLGRNILIAGLSNAQLVELPGRPPLASSGAGSILIGGYTTADNDLSTLEAALAEWSSTDSYATRTAALANTFNTATVLDNGVSNIVRGNGNTAADWFFAKLNGSSADTLLGAGTGDIVTALT